jgi:tetratricopeptide (TPR) repeat protein
MAGNYAKADTLFSRLIDLKPDEILGHKYRLLTRSRMLDPEAKTGVLIPEHEKFIEFATAKDPVKYKADIINSYTYIGKYYLNAKKLDKSKEYWKMILTLDPNDSNAKMVLSNLK